MSGTTTRPNDNIILDLMRDDDMGDPWGTAIAWAFGVAEVLHAAGEAVPAELEFSPSPFVATRQPSDQPEEYPDAMVWEALYDWRAATVSDLQFAGRCLARYLDWLEAAGRDY